MNALAARLLDRGYQLGPRLGAGYFAHVFQVTDLATGAISAAKVYEVTPGKRAAATREVEALGLFDHPRLPRLVEWFEAGEWVVVVMDLVPGPNVRDEVADRGPLATTLAANMGIELCEVLGYIAALGWTYRDLHVKNIHRDTPIGTMLLDLDGARPPGWPGQPSGRSGYRAPELERSRVVTPACDVYSLAGCLHFALSGDDPPDRLGRIAGLRRRMPVPLADLLNACRRIDPSDRPTVHALSAGLRAFAS